MNYRKLGKPAEEVSILGFGIMRMPILDNDHSKIDWDQGKAMIDYALENGINYFDTAYPYHREQSEGFLGKALANKRKDVFIADKLPVWKVEEYSDFDKLLNEQLQRLGTDYIDFYLLHALEKKRWKKVKDLGVLTWLEEKKKEGKIKHIGFSFHDELKVFKEIIDSYNWEFCQIQYNYMDTDFQAGEEGMKYADGKGIDVIIMEPIKGGLLAKNAPDDVLDAVKGIEPKATNVDMSLRWLWQQPEVKLVLSGMSNMQQLSENIGSASAKSMMLNSKEENYINKMREAFKSRKLISCTNCKYCMPCPEGVAIPGIFYFYNTANIYNDPKWGKSMYKFLGADHLADKCVACGKCETKCPQSLSIIELLKQADEYLRSE